MGCSQRPEGIACSNMGLSWEPMGDNGNINGYNIMDIMGHCKYTLQHLNIAMEWMNMAHV